MIYDICIYMYVTHTYKYIYRLYLKSLALMSRETLLHDGGGGAEGPKILNSSKFLFFFGSTDTASKVSKSSWIRP